jgi:hypothetical protein
VTAAENGPTGCAISFVTISFLVIFLLLKREIDCNSVATADDNSNVVTFCGLVFLRQKCRERRRAVGTGVAVPGVLGEVLRSGIQMRDYFMGEKSSGRM